MEVDIIIKWEKDESKDYGTPVGHLSSLLFLTLEGETKKNGLSRLTFWWRKPYRRRYDWIDSTPFGLLRLFFEDFRGIGMGSPRLKKELVISVITPNCNFSNQPKEKWKQLLKFHFIDNDANVAAFWERWMVPENQPDVVPTTLGTGVGGWSGARKRRTKTRCA